MFFSKVIHIWLMIWKFAIKQLIMGVFIYTWSTGLCTLKPKSFDAPLSSLMDSIASPKVKITKEEGIGARYLARNTLRVEGMLEL
jgi:hypothetical protein